MFLEKKLKSIGEFWISCVIAQTIELFVIWKYLRKYSKNVSITHKVESILLQNSKKTRFL